MLPNTSAQVLRTPDSCFADLPDYPFAPHYLNVTVPHYGNVRMHYVDEAPVNIDSRTAPVVLMLHGEPSWSFAWRKVITPVVAAGYRVIAPDHIGFGKSDKLPLRSDYSVQLFVDALQQLITTLDLQRITLLCQDWGGPIGLRVLSLMPQRFDAVAAGNTLLPTCEPPPRGVAEWPGPIINGWVNATQKMQDMVVSDVIAAVSVTAPTADVLAAYNAPFPDARYKAAALVFPSLIPLHADAAGVAENRAAWAVLAQFNKPFLTLFSDSDPSTKAWERVFRDCVPGAQTQPQIEIANAGHFLQEEQPQAVAQCVLGLLQRVYG